MSTYSTEGGLSFAQRRALAGLPESVREDWVWLCRQYEVEWVEPDIHSARGGWAVDPSGQDRPVWAPSALELIEITR